MTATITKDFSFSASHHLDKLPPDHQCARQHGHNYTVRAQLTGGVNGPGFVVDYGDLAPFGSWLDTNLDHRDLNDMLSFNPTAELLAHHLVRVLRDTLGARTNLYEIAVGVSETPKTWAWVAEKW